MSEAATAGSGRCWVCGCAALDPFAEIRRQAGGLGLRCEFLVLEEGGGQ